jgi:hypothetical protein
MAGKILIDGDFIIEHHLFKGARPFPDSDANKKGSRIVEQKGGAHLLVQLCDDLCESLNKDADSPRFEVLPGNGGNNQAVPENHRSYALWEPSRKTADIKDKNLVWRRKTVCCRRTDKTMK